VAVVLGNTVIPTGTVALIANRTVPPVVVRRRVRARKTLLHPSLWAAAVALVGLGHPEPAAVLVGAADAKGPVGIRRPLEDWGIEDGGVDRRRVARGTR
jgi:hypothetical protein